MATYKRLEKGSPLTAQEHDANVGQIIANKEAIESISSGVQYAIPQSGNTAANEPAPTTDGVYPITTTGTYTNFDGIVVADLTGLKAEIIVSNGQTVFTLNTTNVDVKDAVPTPGSTNGVQSGGVFDQTKNFIGDLSTSGSFVTHRNLLNEVIEDIKVSPKEGKVYMLGNIAFNDATFKDYTRFYEGVITNGEFVSERSLIAIPSGQENPKIPTTLEGKVIIDYQLIDGVVITITFNFDKISGWTNGLFNLSGDPSFVADGAYISPKKHTISNDLLIRNYQGSNFTGTFQFGDVSAQNLLNDVIEDSRVTGSEPGYVFQIMSMAFKHATLKDYIRIRRGTKDSAGLPVWVDSEIVYSGQDNPDMPATLEGKVVTSYTVFDSVKIELWLDLDKATFSLGDLIDVSSDSSDYGYNAYINEKKYLPIKDYVRRNYQGNLYVGNFQGSEENAANLMQEVIVDYRFIGSVEEIYQLRYFCFKHATLKDYFRIRKGTVDAATGLPIWDATDQILYSGTEHPDYPDALTGKVRARYELSQNVDLEIWFDFDKATFSIGAAIDLSTSTSTYAYNTYISKTKMIPVNRNIPTASYPTFPSKKFLIFGDSNTDQKDNTSWVDFAMPALGGPTFTNYADGGGAYVQRFISGVDDMPTQLTNAAAQTDVDAVIVALGTNDRYDNGTNLVLGSYDTAMAKTIANLDIENTLYDAIRFAFHTIQDTWNCKCYAMLPIQRASANYSDTIELQTAIQEMAISYGFEIIDGRKCGIVHDFEVVDAEGRDLSDGLHPKNDDAKKKIAKMVVSAVRNTLTDL